MHHPAYTTNLLDCQNPTFVVSMKILFICLFWSWVEGSLVLGCRSLSAAKRVSQSKISVSNPSYLSLTVPWMEVDIYEGWL